MEWKECHQECNSITSEPHLCHHWTTSSCQYQLLTKQLVQVAATIPTWLRRWKHGNERAILSAAKYAAISNTSFNIPVHSEVYLEDADNNPEFKQDTRMNMRLYKTCAGVIDGMKKILEKVDSVWISEMEEKSMGYVDVFMKRKRCSMSETVHGHPLGIQSHILIVSLETSNNSKKQASTPTTMSTMIKCSLLSRNVQTSTK